MIEGTIEIGSLMLDKLHYTPRTVHEIEQGAKKSIMEAVGDLTMENLCFLIMKGLNCKEKEADKAIEEYLEETQKDTMEIRIAIIRRLETQGFLPKALKIAEKLSDGIEQAANMKIDPNISGLNG